MVNGFQHLLPLLLMHRCQAKQEGYLQYEASLHSMSGMHIECSSSDT